MITTKFGQCVECPDIKEKPLAHVKLSLCEFHNRVRKSKIYSERQRQRIKNGAVRKPTFISRKSSGNKKPRKVQGINDDERWYRKAWASRPHVCEECGYPLGEQFRRIFVSHILTKGAHDDLRTHPQNFNLLCPAHHDQWEFRDRENMAIYENNRSFMERYTILKH